VSERVTDTATALAVLAGELEQVEQEIAGALADLHAPFSQLVGAQLRRSSPLRCAAFVLTAGGAEAGSQAGPQDQQKRIDLAAAIEVLRLALAVHTQLLHVGGDTSAPDAPDTPDTPIAAIAAIDRSLLGSTILAGDYCFSRAAALAARTDSPAVVDIFAQALQRVSEGTLRGLFRSGEDADGDAGTVRPSVSGVSEVSGVSGASAAGISAPEGSFGVERELCLAGVLAAGELAGLDAAERQADQQTALLLLDRRQGRAARGSQLAPEWPAPVTPTRRARWLALAEWLRGE